MNNYVLLFNKTTSHKQIVSISNSGEKTNLDEVDTILFLSDIDEKEIISIEEYGENAVKITFDDGTNIYLNDVAIFNNYGDINDYYYERIADKVKNYFERAALKEYEKDNDKKTKVNRNRKIFNFNTIARASVGAATLLILAIPTGRVYSSIHAKETAPIVEQTPAVEQVIIREDPIAIDLDSSEEIDDSIEIFFPFDDLGDNENLQRVNENCKSYLEPLIERYGLPDTIYAMVAQESGGNLDMEVNSWGSCGPMQIQVNSIHGEYFKVPVYENGKLTGEYDEFWAVDKNRLDDSALEGKKVLVIQNLEDNFQIGCALYRRCIDKYENIFVATDAYNKGLYALEISGGEEIVELCKINYNDFSWREIIRNYYGDNYGDKEYLEHVFRYYNTDDRGEANIEYYCNGRLIKCRLTNLNLIDNTDLEEVNLSFGR